MWQSSVLKYAVGFFWSRRFIFYVVAVGVFPDVFANLWLAVRHVSGARVIDAVVAAAEGVGASAYKLGTALELLNGGVTVDEALTRPFFESTVEAVEELPGWLQGVVEVVAEFVLIPEVLAVFLVLSAVGTAVIYYRLWERVIILLSRTSPSDDHYLLMGLLYLTLVVLYSVLHGLGVDYVVSLQAELMELVDVWAGSQVGVNESVNGSVNASGAVSG